MADTALAPTDFDMKVDSTPEVDSDPASSLRAAALLTLKSKRRKTPSNPVVPIPRGVRPPAPPEPTFHLDYGQEDGNGDSTSSPSSSHPPSPQKSRLSEEPLESNMSREEGEISDEEEEPPPPQLPSNSRPPATDTSKEPFNPALHAALTQKERSMTSPNPHLSIRALNLSNQQSMTDPLMAKELIHARPGVMLNTSEYEAAKDAVLDLLGWGVHPEYLVKCGLRRETLFHVFNELNLRLPSNLDTTGLEPYIPDGSPNSPRIQHSRKISVHAMAVDDEVRQSENPEPMDTTPSVDAVTLEQQRRQELLARKAVLASLKAKKAAAVAKLASTPSNTSSPNLSGNGTQDSLVDDFLKSIETTSPIQDVDMAPPTATIDGSGTTETDVKPTTIVASTNLSDPPPESPVFTNSPIECPPSSTDSVATEFIHSSTGAQTPVEQPSVPRSKQRRPVAADFDDLYNTSRSSTMSNGSGRRNGVTFAGLTQQRRCVIDISDSEGDTDGEAVVREIQKLKRSARSSPFPTRAQSMANTPIGAPTPPPQTPTPVAGQSGRSGSLAQKEIEIQRMKELIAKMEQNRKTTKTISTRGSSTPMKHEEPEVPSSTSLTPPTSDSSTPIVAIHESESKVTVDETKDEVMLELQKKPTNSEMDETPNQPESNGIADEPSPLAESEQHSGKEHGSTMTTLGDNDGEIIRPALYTSLFSFYPSLATELELEKPLSAPDSDVDTVQNSSMGTTPSFFVDNTLPSHFPSRPPTPDLKQLRLSVLTKNLDPSKRICRFEVPGGGICRDEGCEDVHLSRISGQNGMEPTDEDTAQFLLNALPANWLMHHNATYAKLYSVLQQIRTKASDLALEQRVAEALATFGPS